MNNKSKISMRYFKNCSLEPDFTIWLSKFDNISYIEKLINKKIIKIQPELPIGNDSLDIYAETEDGKIVAIENQYGIADNAHFGKLLEYASYVDADIVVLISESVDEEHFKIMPWLNDFGTKQFYHIIVEYYKNDENPTFHIANDNDIVTRNKKGGATSKPSKAQYYEEFWKVFEEEALKKHPSFSEDFSYILNDEDAITLTIKKGGNTKPYSLNVFFRAKKATLGAEIQFKKRYHNHYEYMEKQKDSFISLYGSNVEFKSLKTNPTIQPVPFKASITNRSKYIEYAQELIDMIYKLVDVASNFDEIY